MVRPGHRTHHPLPARAILPRDPARRTAQPEGTRGRYERGLVSQTPPHLQRHTRRCAATLLAGTGFCHVPPSRRGEQTPPSAPGRHYLCALPRCLMAKVEIITRFISSPWPWFAVFWQVYIVPLPLTACVLVSPITATFQGYVTTLIRLHL